MRFTNRRGAALRFLLPVLAVVAFGIFVVGAQAGGGSLDGNYGNDGKSYADFNGQNDFATSLFLDESNRAIVGGYTEGANDDMMVARFKQTDGSLDGSAFAGDTGVLTIDLGGNERANDLVVNNGKLIIAGQTDEGGNDDLVILQRQIPGGKPDLTFNTAQTPGTDVLGGGGFRLDLGGNEVGTVVKRLPDGKFLVGGTTDVNGTTDFLVARFTNKGLLDPRFTNDNTTPGVSSPMPGVILIDFGGADHLTGLWAYSNTAWFASGYSDANGGNDIAFAGFSGVSRVDKGFGGQGNGRVLWDLGGDDVASSVRVDNNKKIIVGGSTGGDMMVARFKPKAKGLDTSFPGAGVELLNFGGNDAGNALLYQARADRRILPAGSTDESGNNDFAFERLGKDGSPDTSFGNAGQVTTNFNGTSDDVATGIGMETTSSNVIVSGYSNANGNYDFAVARYLATR